MNRIINILGADPGRTKDPFAIVLIAVDIDAKTITIKGARQFVNQKFQDVELEISKIVKKLNIDYIAVETNFNAETAENLRFSHNLPVRYVYTTKNLREEKPGTMDKNAMTLWLIRVHQDGILKWSELSNDYMKELYRQWTMFGEYHKDRYEAPPGDHDDMLMALMLACFIGKQILESTGLVIVNASRLQESRSEQLSRLNEERDAGNTGLSFELKE